jgi:mono/diheme cytochrome c family protein
MYMEDAMKSWMLMLPLAIVGCGDKGDTADPVTSILGMSGDAAAGEAVYTATCSGCHGAAGEGGTGPALSDVVADHSEEHMISVIYYGDGTMPAYGGTLAEQDIADVVAYIVANY